MPIASTDEQLALQASVREWAKRSAVIDVVRGLEPGAGALERRRDDPDPAVAGSERQLGLPREEVR